MAASQIIAFYTSLNFMSDRPCHQQLGNQSHCGNSTADLDVWGLRFLECVCLTIWRRFLSPSVGLLFVKLFILQCRRLLALKNISVVAYGTSCLISWHMGVLLRKCVPKFQCFLLAFSKFLLFDYFLKFFLCRVRDLAVVPCVDMLLLASFPQSLFHWSLIFSFTLCLIN